MPKKSLRAWKRPAGGSGTGCRGNKLPGGFRSLYEKLRAGNNVDVNLDAVHDIATLYAYCSYDEYLEILNAVYGPENTCDCNTAIGQSSSGRWKDNKYITVITVWINNVRKKDETLSIIVHEMSHVADFMLEACHISDENGEARAHIMEAEARRVFKSMYGANERNMADIGKIIENLSEISAGEFSGKDQCDDR